MDKLIIEFNKKFDKQKQELIDGFKALGEEKRLPKALATIEGEQPTYKDYFKAGWQSRQAELDQQKLLTLDSELHLDAAKEEIERLKGVVDKALNLINNWWHPNVDQKLFIEGVSKALRGKDQYTEHRSKAEQQINKGARLTKHQIDLGDNNANS